MSKATTPRPWKHATLMGIGPNGEKVFHCGLGIEQEANAALIVRAVNAHDALIEALREAELQIKYLHWRSTGSGNAVLAKIRAALALAEGKP